ncbi:MAG TPA: type II secretion system protein [Terriglobales bacterium]|nr:type II secretion system protein [Terriglobales bacterium]
MVISRSQRGFTLIELLIVISLVLILLSFAIPNYRQSVVLAKETVLKDDLFTLRRTIDEFTYDRKRAPQSLDELVQTGYLKQIPKDPITNAPNWDPIMEVDAISEGVEIGIADIHSHSELLSTQGTAYNSW